MEVVMNKGKKSKKRIVIIIVVVTVIVVAAFGYNNVMKSKTEGEATSNIKEIEYEVKKDEIKKSITGSSSLEPSDVRIVSSEVEGSIDGIYVEEGQVVMEDEILAIYEIESDDESQQLEIDLAEYNLAVSESNLYDLYETAGELKIYAEYDGTVSFDVEEGDEVGKNSKIAELSEVNLIKVQSYFTNTQIENISNGDQASVFLSDYLITLDGKVTAVNKTPAATGGGSVGYLTEVEIEYQGALSEGSPVKITIENAKGTFTSPYSGTAVSNDLRQVYSPYNGEIDKLYYNSGDYVSKGDLIAVVASSDLIKEIEQTELIVVQKKLALDELNEEDSIVTSPIGGTILSVYVDEQGYVEKGNQLFQVANLDNMEIVISVDELDILNITKGQSVIVQCDVFEGEVFSGIVNKISLSGNSQNGVTTYKVGVLIEDRKEMMAGMNVDAEIIIEEKSQTLVVPVAAIKRMGNKYVVMTKDEEGNLTSVKVEVGITNDKNVEVVAGLSEGDLIYYNEAISTENDFDSMKIPGMGGVKRSTGGKEQ
jgi:HlyD family secretion protein